MVNDCRKGRDWTLAWIIGGLLVAASAGALVGTAAPSGHEAAPLASNVAGHASSPSSARTPSAAPAAPVGGFVASSIRDGAARDVAMQAARGIELDPMVQLDDGLDDAERRQWERGNAESMRIMEASTPEMAGSRD